MNTDQDVTVFRRITVGTQFLPSNIGEKGSKLTVSC